MLKNPKVVADNIISWIQDYMAQAGDQAKVVIGLSGGKDSSVTAALCVAALGKERVLGVLMPNGQQKDIDDAKELADYLGIARIIVNIHDGVTGLASAIETSFKEGCKTYTQVPQVLSPDSMINLPARMRMATLYAVAQSLPGGGRVVNTCNASEDYVGYSTKYGDAAGDFSPLQQILVEEVRQIGSVLNIPSHLIVKAPSDGLSGMTDEDKLGFTYACLDHYILTGHCDNSEIKERIDLLHRNNLHKLQLMPAFQLEEHAR